MRRAGLRPALVSRMTILLAVALPVLAQPAPKPWREILKQRLELYGHRNWIVIADSAYPLQSAPGIETIASGESQIETVREVLATLSRTPQVRPVVYIDAELPFVSEQDAPGISAYRQLLDGLWDKFFQGQKPVSRLHESIISQLDQASKTFNVLIIKTNMMLPYTSVFLELRAGYWSDEAEQRLRQSVH